MYFGKMLQEARQAKHLSLRVLAKKIGYHYSLLSEIENGRRMMPDNRQLLESISGILDINIEEARRQIEIDRAYSNPKKLIQCLMQDKQLSRVVVAAAYRFEINDVCDLIKGALREKLEACNA